MVTKSIVVPPASILFMARFEEQVCKRQLKIESSKYEHGSSRQSDGHHQAMVSNSFGSVLSVSRDSQNPL